MASDLSNILKDELGATLSQLLSASTKVIAVKSSDGSSCADIQLVKVDTKFDFKTLSTVWSYFVPTSTATKFEYMMLGGMGDLKTNIDDEISDAVNEIISNVCGSISTSVNAQGFDDLGGVKFENRGNSIFNGASLKDIPNLYEISMQLGGEDYLMLISFDQIILPFFKSITGASDVSTDSSAATSPQAQTFSTTQTSSANAGMLALLGDEAVDNLKLLFDIKLKLSVRLGTKVLLLKDVMKWDIGEIIELEQMVSEPLDILVNGIKIGVGEAVVVEGKFGLKVRTIGNDKLKLSAI